MQELIFQAQFGMLNLPPIPNQTTDAIPPMHAIYVPKPSSTQSFLSPLHSPESPRVHSQFQHEKRPKFSTDMTSQNNINHGNDFHYTF